MNKAMRKKIVPVILLGVVVFFLLGAGEAERGEPAEGKFREVPLSWILDWEEKLRESIMTPSGPEGEPITSAKQLKLSPAEIKAAREMEFNSYIFMGATLDTTEILNKVGMDEVLANIGKPPIEFLGSESISEQIDQIHAMAARAHEIDFIIAEAYESETTGPVFVELAQAGVPQLHNWATPRGVSKERNYIGLVDADGYGQSAVAAEILAYMMNYEGEVGLIYFALEQWTNVVRYKAAQETFAKYPNIKVVSEKGFTDPNQGREIALGMLQAQPEIFSWHL